MTASSTNEPVTIPQSAAEQMAELQRLVQEGRAKLVGSDGRQIELPDAVQELLITILKHFQAGKASVDRY